MTEILSFHGLGKAWFGVPAVSDMTLGIAQGEVLGLIGENGAGKSTLMNVIGGVVAPTSGHMEWKGQPYAPASAADAAATGIAFIHQELNLFTNLSVAENIFIDAFPRRFGLVDRRAMKARTSEILSQLNLEIDPDASVLALAPGERQLVEIAKALHRDAELIIFDEPTTSLTARETARLFDTIAAMQAAGKTVIYISHILGDVARLCDRVAVLRDGRLVDKGRAANFTIERMINSMIGRDLGNMYPPRSAPPRDDVVLDLSHLSQPGVIEDVSLQVRAGEILGLFGLMGSGRSELARIVFGLDMARTGHVTLNGQPLSGGPRARIAAGMAFVTEDRREEGLMMDATIRENLSQVAVERFGRGPVGMLDDAALAQDSAMMRDEMQIRAGDIARQPVRALSGGNQQKVVIGKWLMNAPKLFILDEPTRGVDVGARHEIYGIVDRLAAEGNGILLISSELDELIGIADRIAVMRRGEVMGQFERAGFSDVEILAMAFGERAA